MVNTIFDSFAMNVGFVIEVMWQATSAFIGALLKCCCSAIFATPEIVYGRHIMAKLLP